MATRRQLIVALAAARPMARAAESGGVTLRASRFLMKGEFPRVEVRAPGYRFHWHGRFFGFRLAAPPFDDRVSYTDFGSFEAGGIDLVCSHYHQPAWTDASGKPVRFNQGVLWLTHDRPATAFRAEHAGPGGSRIAALFRFSANPPHIRVTFEPAGFPASDELTLSLPGNLVFDRAARAARSARYFSSGCGVGLEVAGEPGRVAVMDAPDGRIITCRVPAGRASSFAISVLASNSPANSDAAAPSVAALERVALSSLPVWEKAAMKARGWSADRGRAKERVAGLFVSAADWRQPVSWLPESRIEWITAHLLDRIARSRAFDAVGLSRDGITERKLNRQWLELVAAVHRKGLRVFMKPGDGELTALRSPGDIAAWGKACFDVAPEERCDVVRLPGEAVVHPWVTANLCLESPFVTAPLRQLDGLAWPAATKQIVQSVADRFSLVIDSIRRHAPKITIDLECCDTAVLDVLLRRHQNLGVMYMAYGQYPRVADYLDLYQCVARRQFGAARVALETDCYYSHRITGLGQLRGTPYEQMYSAEDERLMASKHRHMRSLASDAVWAWGLNIAFTEARFRAICAAYV